MFISISYFYTNISIKIINLYIINLFLCVIYKLTKYVF